MLALGAVVPGLLAGLVTWALTRDRGRARERALAVWARLGTAAAGIQLEVQGAERLEAPRPAVFVLNHQSGVDPLLVCALLRRDFVGLAKRELLRNPLLGPAFAFVGSVFVDRFDPARAREALAPALETLRRGVSIAVAPEGTRSAGLAPGRFRRGGFRLALEARVPVVPIVIHNARDVLPRGAWIMTPARVRVTVCEPVSTADWKPETLDDHVEAIHRLYRETLGV